MRHALATLILAVAAVALWWYWSSEGHESNDSLNHSEKQRPLGDRNPSRVQGLGRTQTAVTLRQPTARLERNTLYSRGLDQNVLLRARIALGRSDFGPSDCIHLGEIGRFEDL